MSEQQTETSLFKRALARRNGAPRWMVTFADMMALLLCFFVLLLSFSTIDMDMFMKNAGPMRTAFNQDGALLPNQAQVNPDEKPNEAQLRADYEAWTNKTFDRLQILLTEPLNNGLVELERKEREVVIRLPSGTAFEPGGIELSDQARISLESVAQSITESEGTVVVSGHTDDIPISTARFRSNWDLSAGRAVSVVHYLLENSPLEPARVEAKGQADSVPLAPNDSPENRALNRRVEINIRFPEPDPIDANKPWYLQGQ